MLIANNSVNVKLVISTVILVPIHKQKKLMKVCCYSVSVCNLHPQSIILKSSSCVSLGKIISFSLLSFIHVSIESYSVLYDKELNESIHIKCLYNFLEYKKSYLSVIYY